MTLCPSLCSVGQLLQGDLSIVQALYDESLKDGACSAVEIKQKNAVKEILFGAEALPGPSASKP
jgi:hypothetical protein